MPIQINAALCKGCGFCARFCPEQALAIGQQRSAKGDFLPIVTPERCTSCITCAEGAVYAICAMMCPEGAITIQGEEVSAP